MQITKQSTSHISVDNLKKLINEFLYKQGYKVTSIDFNIVAEDRKPKPRNNYLPSQETFYGATLSADEIDFKSQSRSLIKIREAIEIKINESELLSLASEYLISEGYQLVGKASFNFAWEDNSDGPHSSSSQVFNGIKCLTNKETKNISIVEGKPK